MEAELLRRDQGDNWPEESEIVKGHAVPTLASVDYAAKLSVFYRTTDLTT
jgi:hypothetical protein